MPRPQRIRIQPRLLVRMEQALLLTTQQSAQTRRIREAENAPVGIMPRRADDRDRLRQHHLIPRARVQVPGREEAGLRRVRVDPAAD